MNKTIIFSAVIFILASCGAKKKKEIKDIEVKASTVKIEGYLGDYLEVVDGSYTATNDKGMIFNWVIKVKVKAKKVFESDSYALSDGNDGPLILSLTDAGGTPLAGFDDFRSSYSDDSKLKDLLKNGNGEVSINFSKIHAYGVESYPENTAGFIVSSEDRDAPKNNTGSSDYDKLLDDYEDYVDSYLKLLKKANDGDASAIAEYPKVYEKAVKLGDDLEAAKGNMSNKQIERFSKILSKMGTAIQEME